MPSRPFSKEKRAWLNKRKGWKVKWIPAQRCWDDNDVVVREGTVESWHHKLAVGEQPRLHTPVIYRIQTDDETFVDILYTHVQFLQEPVRLWYV
jgi:hypothetical protein